MDGSLMVDCVGSSTSIALTSQTNKTTACFSCFCRTFLFNHPFHTPFKGSLPSLRILP